CLRLRHADCSCVSWCVLRVYAVCACVQAARMVLFHRRQFAQTHAAKVHLHAVGCFPRYLLALAVEPVRTAVALHTLITAGCIVGHTAALQYARAAAAAVVCCCGRHCCMCLGELTPVE